MKKYCIADRFIPHKCSITCNFLPCILFVQIMSWHSLIVTVSEKKHTWLKHSFKFEFYIECACAVYGLSGKI